MCVSVMCVCVSCRMMEEMRTQASFSLHIWICYLIFVVPVSQTLAVRFVFVLCPPINFFHYLRLAQ